MAETIKHDIICNATAEKVNAENKIVNICYTLFIHRIRLEPIKCHEK